VGRLHTRPSCRVSHACAAHDVQAHTALDAQSTIRICSQLELRAWTELFALQPQCNGAVALHPKQPLLAPVTACTLFKHQQHVVALHATW
jgi:hypothetical protein